MSKNQQGFGAVEILIAIVAIAIVGAGGYYVYYRTHTNTANTNTSSTSNNSANNSQSNPLTVQQPQNLTPRQHVVISEPIIYLYPTTTEPVNVKLGFKGTLTTSYPAYDPSTGWNVIAYPDGSLTNVVDGMNYSYLFWEGAYGLQVNENEGFVVKASDTVTFLQQSLKQLGLTPKEYNEFIVYWLPKMEHNPYNLIHFAGTEYTDIAPLTITPKPDSMLRVFMAFKPLSQPINVKSQALVPFNRHGFAVVEWGGTELSQ